MANTKIYSLNVRGIRDTVKRRQLFQKFHNSNYDIFMIQEAHCTPEVTSQWSSEWGGEIFFSHGTSNSKGVCILLKNSVSRTIHKCEQVEGRALFLDITINNTKFTLSNIYAPNQDDVDFFINICNILETIGNDLMVVGGDYNCVLDINIDKKGGLPQTHTNSVQFLQTWMEENDMIDIYRKSHPMVLKYTWARRGGNAPVFCRLDFYLISYALCDKVKTVDIKPGFLTDHSAVTLELELYSNPRGPGFWKFNVSLLSDPTYVNLVKNTIATTSLDLINVNPLLKWETMKTIIRGETIKYASRKKRKGKETISKLEQEIEELQSQVTLHPNDNNYSNDLESKRLELENYVSQMTKGSMIRSRARWIEFGEKSTKYFFQMEKRNYNNKVIDALRASNNYIITDPKLILEEESKFYSNLYHEDPLNPDPMVSNIFFPEDHVKLSQDEKRLIENEITENELLLALKSMNNNKSPGTDGFPCEFYKVFWLDLRELFTKVVKECYTQKLLGISQRQGVLTLLPKKDKDPLEIQNWRPLTLLNTDYKIIAKVIASRIKKYLNQLVNQDQTGCIKGRYIGENILKILSIMEYMEDNNKPGLLILVDFEKAFDNVNWEYLDKVLEYFNLGDYIRNWIKILYTKCESCVINNGWVSNRFPIEKGVRQGCPLSAILFTLCVEILANYIRKNENIKGIKIDEAIFKIIQFADDTALPIEYDAASLTEVICTFDLFYTISGLKVNYNKTEILRIGSIRNSNARLYTLKPIQWSEGIVSVLGVTISTDRNELIDLNYNKVIRKMENVVKIWKSRGLTIYGKNVIIKGLIASQLTYIVSVLPCPSKQQMEKIKEIIMNFFWDGKRSKIAFNNLINSYDEGGINLLDIEAHVKALKVSWINRLSILMNNSNQWLQLAKICLGTEPYALFAGNLNLKDLHKQGTIKSTIWLEILNYWFEYCYSKPQNVSEILAQPLWYNSNITMDNKPVFIRSAFQENIKCINDIIDGNGNILNYMEFRRKYNIDCHMILYFGLVAAIPQEWKMQLRDNYQRNITPSQSPYILVNKKNKITKFVYNKFISKIKTNCQPKLDKWKENINYAGEGFSLSNCFSLLYQITLDNKLRSFQYRFLHRIIPTNYLLEIWKIKEFNSCSFCNLHPETLCHLFLQCRVTNNIIAQFTEWWNYTTNSILQLTNTDIVFGLHLKDPYHTLLNTLLLVLKQYIFASKCLNKMPNFEVLKTKFAFTYNVELTIANNKGKQQFHNKKWNFIKNALTVH